MKNPFFNAALRKASKLAGKPARILTLVSKLAVKSREIDWQKVNKETVKEKYSILYRLAKAYAKGDYRQIPWRSMLVLLAAIIYFLNPIDLIPDIIPVFGLSDDFAVLLWVYKTVSDDVNNFLAWEKTQLQ